MQKPVTIEATACKNHQEMVRKAAHELQLVLFRPGLARLWRLWPGFGWLWLAEYPGQAVADGLSLARPGFGPARGLVNAIFCTAGIGA